MQLEVSGDVCYMHDHVLTNQGSCILHACCDTHFHYHKTRCVLLLHCAVGVQPA